MKAIRSAARLCIIVAAGTVAVGCASPGRTQRHDVGFLYSRDLTLDGAGRSRAAGPLFESQCSTQRVFSALRPLYSELEDSTRDRTSRYVLWPVASHREMGKESSWRFLLLFGHDFDKEEPGSRYRLFLFPAFFAGRDAQREPYMALFPLGGTVHEFLGQDRITFFLFPLYCHTSVNQVHSWNVLWPIFSRTEGPGVHRARAFPFYGVSEREGKWAKRFVLWPLWTQTEYMYTNASGHAWMLWPLVGRVKLENQSSWMVLPPFFRWTRTEDRVAFYGPWPFFQYGSGDENRLYLWPLWGTSRRGEDHSGFALWPIVRWGRKRSGDQEKSWTTVAPVWHSGSFRSVSTNVAHANWETAGRNVKLWPLFSYRRVGNASFLRIPELWPLPPAAGVEQNWAPLWTLYSQSRWAGAEEDEFLWGLYRHRADAEGWSLSLFPLFFVSAGDGGRREWSVLQGLVGYRRSDEERMIRLLYVIRIRTEYRKEPDDQTP